MKKILLCLTVSILSGCTAITVRPPDPSVKISHVVIRDNPKVIVKGFVDVMRDGFDRHGISSEIAPAGATISPEAFTVTYTALRSWDLAPYLSHAEIRIEHEGRQIAYAEYHLKGKGGYSMYKWEGVKTKMDPVMDQLLQGVKVPVGNTPMGPTVLVKPENEHMNADLYTELTKLDDLRKKGIITDAEFAEQKKRLLEAP